ncbi:hypothetical protein N7448_011075 [Penicillium atrosanguineum]|nr:hypothetical protein N7448_011075 [Penicillium atrosanguineum]
MSWAEIPAHLTFSTPGFGGTSQSSGSGVLYKGNTGVPYGSNIITTTAEDANMYKYVVRFQGFFEEPWTVVIWNKYSADGTMNGWYGRACKVLQLGAGEARGGWAAAPGLTIPTDSNGSYASTWGEFDFGSSINMGWSGFDVSAIMVQKAGLEIQSMKICDVLSQICSYITPKASMVSNAYTEVEADIGGIGGNISPGPVRLSVTLGYTG